MPTPDYQPKAYAGRPKSEIAKLRDSYINPAVYHYYNDYEYIVDGHKQYVFNEQGRQFIDLFGGINVIGSGHSHPYINEKIIEQVGKIHLTSNLYLTEPMALLAEKIVSKMPSSLDSVYFCNSGSEANDLALLLSKLHTRNHQVITLNNCYHGALSVTTDLTSLRTWKHNIPKYFDVRHVMQPYQYRHPFGDDKTATDLTNYAINDLQNAIDFDVGDKVAAFYTEAAFQGVGGLTSTQGDGTYHERAFKIIRDAGGLCIADEVQCGWGRIGDRYWGFEKQNIVPDIVTVAKCLGNGIPIAAVITRREIAEQMTKKVTFNTYGGNPLSCAAALANLEVIDNENLQENCRVVGGYFTEELKKLQEKYEIIGDVRGFGLAIGIELVKNRETKEPAPKEVDYFLEEARKAGILIGKGSLYGNCLRVQPPMCLSKPDVEYCIHVFDKIFQSINV